MNEKMNFSVDPGNFDIGISVAGGPGIYYRVQNTGSREFFVVRKLKDGGDDLHNLPPHLSFDIYKAAGDSLLVRPSGEGTIRGWFQILAAM